MKGVNAVIFQMLLLLYLLLYFLMIVIRYGSKDGKAKGSWRAGLTKLALNSLEVINRKHT